LQSSLSVIGPSAPGLAVHQQRGLELEPGLATSWRVVDPLAWEFELRQGVRFHDGTPLTAEDVAFSIDRARDEDSELNLLLDSVARVEVVDPGTVCRAQCEKPYGDRGCAAYSS
jgi:peptide/nickel transport system substrate-binding protein